MKKSIKFFVVILLIIKVNSYCQNKQDSFLFSSIQIEYNLKLANNKTNNFNIVIVSDALNKENLKNKIQGCYDGKTNFSKTYFIVIPNEFSDRKEEFVTLFICDILSKTKLVDFEMNVISDGNYFANYEEIRTKNNGNYQNCFLNKINAVNLINSNIEICSFLK